MTISSEEIKKLRRELERDLEALERVEKLLAKRSATMGQSLGVVVGSESPRLMTQTLDAIRLAGTSGLRANEVVEALIEKGYPFKDKKKGASSVSTTLKRLVKKKQIEKVGKVYTAKPAA
jgi:hypothetical protein